MKILILGANGMLGHQLVQSLSVNHEVAATDRRELDVRDFDDVWSYVGWKRPEVVINCVGIVKQRESSATEMIRINALFPHQLALATRNFGVRLIHFSTDCVFSGWRGAYTENNEPDPQDLYGRSKLLGEISDKGCITLRTSIIGRELGRKRGLAEWFLSQTGTVHGFNNSYFSGVTTLEMARIVERILRSPGVHGTWHAGGDSIDKYRLLQLLQLHYGRTDIELMRDPRPKCNRVLRSDRFQQYFGYTPPSWNDMIREMADAER